MILVSLYDAKAETWTSPRVCANVPCAIREFGALVNDGANTIVSANPTDFDLFQVAELPEPFVGKVVPLDAPKHIANGKDVKAHE